MRVVLTLITALAACDGGNGTTSSSTAGTTGGTNGGYSCCLNGAYYSCPKRPPFTKCGGMDVAACPAPCAPADIQCNLNCDMMAANAMHDPSSCQRNAGKDNTCSISMTCQENTSNPTC